jgi:putative ABC transport system permease protein
MLRDLLYRVRALFRRRELECEMDDEMRFHLEHEAEKLVKRGWPREEAWRRARLAFGAMDAAKEECRDVRRLPIIETTIQDVRYGLRVLGKKRGLTAVAVIILALGIGANAAIFSIVDAVLLRALPYKHPDRLTVIWESDTSHRKTGAVFDTYREFEEWKRYSHSFEQLAAASWANTAQTLLWHGKLQSVVAIPTSVDFFSMLGVPAAQGRTFGPQDLKDPCAVVLANGFWRDRLGSTLGWVGRILTLNNKPCAVIGIMPKGFSFYPKQAQLWTLITPGSEYAKRPWDMDVGVFGLLKPGISRASAEAELTALQTRIIGESRYWASLHMEPDVLDLKWEFTWLTGRNLRASLVVLFVAVVFVLLIACVNVANLLLGRASERQKELGIRAALGSGRSRLIRQLLTESVLLSVFGASAGIAVAFAAIRYVRTANPVDLPPGNPIAIDGRVLLFTAVVAVLTGLLFGLLPSWKASRLNLNEVLKETRRGASGGAAGHGAGNVLVVAEVALSLVLLVGAALLVESVDRLSSTPLGFQPDHLLTASLNLPSQNYSASGRRWRFYEGLMRAVSALPGVSGVAVAPQFPSGDNPLTAEGSASSGPRVDEQSVSADYFHVMRVPVLRGREFDQRDREKSLPVAIINEALANDYFLNRDPLGERIKLGEPDENKPWLTIVGVVGSVKTMTVFKEMGYALDPCVYRPLSQDVVSPVAVFARTVAKPLPVAPAIRRAVSALDSELPPPDVETMNNWLSGFRSQPRFRAMLLTIFAGLALLLAAIGIYGVLAQSVTQRTHEIGIRMALGAQPGDILRQVVFRGMALALMGLGTGVVAAFGLTQLLANLLYGVRPTDPITFAAVSFVLTAVALLASYIPARRAIKVDPMAALRSE